MGRGLGKNSFASWLLEKLEEASHHNPVGVARAGGLVAYEEMLRWKEVGLKSREISRLRQILKRLEEREYLKMVQMGDKLYIALCDGKARNDLRSCILKKQDILPRGTYCYVSFDIPQNQRHARDALRHLLKQADFQMIHQSVWYTNHDLGKELAAFAIELGVESLVHVFIGEPLTTLATRDTDRTSKKKRKIGARIEAEHMERERLRKNAADKAEQ